ncbi:hypothetical protein BDV3_000953 [Batrachochytrium dendrobatidis]|uniref:Uncharacterized protein n=1 Tax=Batrachochytrium dendrobatidis (strain JEL423) TaxID=403673 RepID=A0A177W8A1_BATDL|nr:hypothetical protein BDEG_20497 [Batrachochytrium dendrobatidis JEL423]
MYNKVLFKRKSSIAHKHQDRTLVDVPITVHQPIDASINTAQSIMQPHCPQAVLIPSVGSNPPVSASQSSFPELQSPRPPGTDMSHEDISESDYESDPEPAALAHHWPENAMDMFAGDADNYMQTSLELHNNPASLLSYNGALNHAVNLGAQHRQNKISSISQTSNTNHCHSTPNLSTKSDSCNTNNKIYSDDDMYEDIDDGIVPGSIHPSANSHGQFRAGPRTTSRRRSGLLSVRQAQLTSSNSQSRSGHLRRPADAMSKSMNNLTSQSLDQQFLSRSLQPDSKTGSLDPVAYQELMKVVNQYSQLINQENLQKQPPMPIATPTLNIGSANLDILASQLQPQLIKGDVSTPENKEILNCVRDNIASVSETLKRLELMLQTLTSPTDLHGTDTTQGAHLTPSNSGLQHRAFQLNSPANSTPSVHSATRQNLPLQPANDTNPISATAKQLDHVESSEPSQLTADQVPEIDVAKSPSLVNDTGLNPCFESSSNLPANDQTKIETVADSCDKDLHVSAVADSDENMHTKLCDEEMQAASSVEALDTHNLAATISDYQRKITLPPQNIGLLISKYSAVIDRLEEPHLVAQRTEIKPNRAHAKSPRVTSRSSMSNISNKHNRHRSGLPSNSKRDFLVQKSSSFEKSCKDADEHLPRTSISAPNLAYMGESQQTFYSRRSSSSGSFSLDEDDPLKVYEVPISAKSDSASNGNRLAKLVKVVTFATKRNFSKNASQSNSSVASSSTDRVNLHSPSTNELSATQHAKDFDDLDKVLDRMSRLDKPDSQVYVRGSQSKLARLPRIVEQPDLLQDSMNSGLSEKAVSIHLVTPTDVQNESHSESQSSAVPINSAAPAAEALSRAAYPNESIDNLEAEHNNENSFDELERALDRMGRMTRMNDQTYTPVLDRLSIMEASTLYEASSTMSTSPRRSRNTEERIEGSTLRDSVENNLDTDMTSIYSGDNRHASLDSVELLASSNLPLHRAVHVVDTMSGDEYDSDLETSPQYALQRLLQQHQHQPAQPRSASLQHSILPRTSSLQGREVRASALRGRRRQGTANGLTTAGTRIDGSGLYYAHIPRDLDGNVLNGIQEEDSWNTSTDADEQPAVLSSPDKPFERALQSESPQTPLEPEHVSQSLPSVALEPGSHPVQTKSAVVEEKEDSSTTVPSTPVESMLRASSFNRREITIIKSDYQTPRADSRQSIGSQHSVSRSIVSANGSHQLSCETNTEHDDDELDNDEDDVYWHQQCEVLEARHVGEYTHHLRDTTSWGDSIRSSVRSIGPRFSAAELAMLGRNIHLKPHTAQSRPNSTSSMSPSRQLQPRSSIGMDRDMMINHERTAPRNNILSTSKSLKDDSTMYSETVVAGSELLSTTTGR